MVSIAKNCGGCGASAVKEEKRREGQKKDEGGKWKIRANDNKSKSAQIDDRKSSRVRVIHLAYRANENEVDFEA